MSASCEIPGCIESRLAKQPSEYASPSLCSILISPFLRDSIVGLGMNQPQEMQSVASCHPPSAGRALRSPVEISRRAIGTHKSGLCPVKAGGRRWGESPSCCLLIGGASALRIWVSRKPRGKLWEFEIRAEVLRR